MFKRINSERSPVAGTFQFEGQSITFETGDTIAAALLCAGVPDIRSHAIDHSPRAPYCMMGVCFECLAVVDGIQNQQTCLLPARDGMVVARQRGAKELR